MKKIVSRTRAQVYKMWLKALRSGEYKRTKGQLRKTNHSGEVTGFCCLGVLQDLATKDGGDKWHCHRDSNTNWYGLNPVGTVREDEATPKQSILDFMGLDQDMVERLIDLNDTKERSFKEIADHIEKRILPKVL
jgi:hypothetical protein